MLTASLPCCNYGMLTIRHGEFKIKYPLPSSSPGAVLADLPGGGGGGGGATHSLGLGTNCETTTPTF